MLSAWTPTADERAAIAAGAPVILSIVGRRDRTHPVVGLYVGAWEGGVAPSGDEAPQPP